VSPLVVPQFGQALRGGQEPAGLPGDHAALVASTAQSPPASRRRLADPRPKSGTRTTSSRKIPAETGGRRRVWAIGRTVIPPLFGRKQKFTSNPAVGGVFGIGRRKSNARVDERWLVGAQDLLAVKQPAAVGCESPSSGSERPGRCRTRGSDQACAQTLRRWPFSVKHRATIFGAVREQRRASIGGCRWAAARPGAPAPPANILLLVDHQCKARVQIAVRKYFCGQVITRNSRVKRQTCPTGRWLLEKPSGSVIRAAWENGHPCGRQESGRNSCWKCQARMFVGIADPLGHLSPVALTNLATGVCGG